jgi:hypothetical protein
MTKTKQRPTIEWLEDRTTPSTIGMAWPYANLTLSFAPDGTSVDGNKSTLFQTLGNQATTKAWEAAIMKAAQTWADVANINIGLTADGGQTIGTNGVIQGDSRFGDIRVAAEPLGAGAQVAIGSPYNPLLGTRAGDLVFNSSYTFGNGSAPGYDIYTVALHELGHSLGLGDNTDPTSVMFNTYQGVRTGLSAGDIAAIQALYGPRTPDAYEGPNGNHTISTAAVMRLPEIAADIGNVGQADYFQYTIPSYSDRTVTIAVQNGGISMLAPRLSVYNATRQLIATSSAADAFSATTSITLGNVRRGTVLFLEVDSPRMDVFGMGSYRLKFNSGAVSQKQIAAIDSTLNGTNITYINFAHSTSTISAAVALDQPIFQIDPRFNYAVNAKLNDASDVDFFSVTTPTTAPQALIFTASPGKGSLLSPDITVYDSNGNVVNAQILSNENTGYVVQVLNPVAGAKYYVAVSADPFAATINDKGAYLLGVTYTNTPIVLQTIVDDSLSSTDMIDVLSLWSTEVQLYHFVLSVDTGGAASGVSVTMQLFDANNNLVLSLVCQDGNTVSADVQLQQGGYTAKFIASSSSGAPIPTTYYTLQGMCLTSNLDPVPVNPTDPSLNGTTSTTSTTTTTTTTTTTDTATLLVTSPPTTPPATPPATPPTT